MVLASGETGHLWFEVTPTDIDPAGFEALELRYLDELGRSHTVSATIGFLAAPAGLPEGIASFDGSIDGMGYSTFMAALTGALDSGDPATVVPFLGGAATIDDAESFLREQRGVDEEWGYMSESIGRHSAEVAYFETTSEDSAPTFTVSWSLNRWSATPS